MECVNHSGTEASAFCQNCGKALCSNCVRRMAGGQVLCDPCSMAWQQYRQPFVTPPPSGPNPAAAGLLGLIPGVGAMYNGQFFKGLIHVVVFAVLVSITSTYNGIFGIFIGAWVLYQSFEAFHTAKALRDGTPVPDPFGLNEVGNWLNLGAKPPAGAQTQAPGAAQAPPNPDPYQAGAYQASGYQAPYTPYTYPEPPSPPVPPAPPVPPVPWRRREPIGAIVLIGLGLLFLLGQLDFFNGRMFEFTWPIMLIGLGVWLIVRRVADSQGGPK